VLDHVEELPDLGAPELLGPLQEAFVSIRDRLQARLRAYRSPTTSFWNTVFLMVLSSHHTMSASLFLVGDKRVEEAAAGMGPGPFPAQAVILQRALFELLGNVMALLEEPISRDALFRRDGYREDLKLYRAQIPKAGNPRWDRWLQRGEEQLRGKARFLRLTTIEAADPNQLRSWPSPKALTTGRDLNGRAWLSAERLRVIQTLYEDSYGPDSRVVHQKDSALRLARMRNSGINLELLARLRTVPALRASMFDAAVLTEVESAMTWSAGSALRTSGAPGTCCARHSTPRPPSTTFDTGRWSRRLDLLFRRREPRWRTCRALA
jgi:hypothetical protein